MALEQITFNIGAFNDSDAGGNNYFANTVFEVKNQSDNTFAVIYADESGTTQIPQNGIDNVSSEFGECVFYINTGDYHISVNSKSKRFTVGNKNLFTSVSEMNTAKLSSSSEFSMVEWQGYYSQGDGGGNWGVLRFGAHTEDGGSIFSIDSNIYIEAVTDFVDVYKFGFFGVGNPSDTDRLIAAISYAKSNKKKIFAEKRSDSYYIAKPVDFSGVEQIEFLGDINTSMVSGEPALIVGGYSNGGGTPDWSFKDVTDGTSTLSPTPANPIVRVLGMKSGSMRIANCNYLQLYADSALSGGTSNGYNEFNFNGVVRRVEITGNTGFSWNTENEFYGGRIIELFIEKGLSNYPHNRNIFKRQTFEGADVDIRFNGCTNNGVYSARFEYTTDATITADVDSVGNFVERLYTGTGQSRSMFESDYIQILDSGIANNFTSEFAYKFSKSVLCNINHKSISAASATSAASTQDGVLPQFRYVFLNGGNQAKCGINDVYVSANTWFYLSDIIEVDFGDAVSFDYDFSGSLVRSVVFVYDGNQKLITSNSGGDVWSQPGTSFNANGYYAPTSNANSDRKVGSVSSESVKFIRIGLWSSVGGYFNNIKVSLYKRTTGSKGFIANEKPIVIEGEPIQCYLPKYTKVRDSLSSVEYENKYQHETTLSSSAPSGGASLTVDNIGSVADGDIVGVLMSDNTTHWSKVSGLTGSTFSISSLTNSAANGARVVFNRLVDINPPPA
jgi:hypothetical protein